MFHYATVRSKSRANKINALRPLVHSPFRSNCSSWVMVYANRPFRPELSIELTKM